MTKQDQIDISNLRFYAAMAREFSWQTDIIDWRVVYQSEKYSNKWRRS